MERFKLFWIKHAGDLFAKKFFTFWNNMCMEGLIPPKIAKGVISNDRLMFGPVETYFMNVACIRKFWSQFTMDKDSDTICKTIIASIPGKKCVCTTCGWHIPKADMENDAKCSYCSSGEFYIDHYKGSPHMKYTCDTVRLNEIRTIMSDLVIGPNQWSDEMLNNQIYKDNFSQLIYDVSQIRIS